MTDSFYCESLVSTQSDLSKGKGGGARVRGSETAEVKLASVIFNFIIRLGRRGRFAYLSDSISSMETANRSPLPSFTAPSYSATSASSDEPC
jgi:hypothetical protein